MVFSTLTFLFVFLPPVFLLYYAVPNRAFKNAVLLLFSLLFYSWGEPKYLFLMLAAGIVAYVGGLLIRATDKAELKKAKKAVFIITVVLIPFFQDSLPYSTAWQSSDRSDHQDLRAGYRDVPFQ